MEIHDREDLPKLPRNEGWGKSVALFVLLFIAAVSFIGFIICSFSGFPGK